MNNHNHHKRQRSGLILRAIKGFVLSLHRDQRGTMSIVTVFALLMFTMLLVMVVNVGRHIDDKIKMQNAADASAYSGGVVLARGMNGIAFTNHLMCDVFAITAFLREGRDRNAEQFAPQILEAWENAGQMLSMSEFEKFRDLGPAIIAKVPLEQEAVTAFGEMTAAASELALPVFEYILEARLIPEFQNELVHTIPRLAAQAAEEVALRQGGDRSDTTTGEPTDRSGRGPQQGVLWRIRQQAEDADPIEEQSEAFNEYIPQRRTLPVVNPSPLYSDYAQVLDPEAYLTRGVAERRRWARHYLNRWNDSKLRLFFTEAKFSQFGNLWRIATCAQLDKLLIEEYPLSNIPWIIRETESGTGIRQMLANSQYAEVNDYLERNFNFLGVVYRAGLPEIGPGLFQNPIAEESDAITFAQVSVFVPRPRRVLRYANRPRRNDDVNLGGTFGFDTGITAPPAPESPWNPRAEDERWPQENWPTRWDTFNQNWTAKLVPATSPMILEVLQSQPGPREGGPIRRPLLPLNNVTTQDLQEINTH